MMILSLMVAAGVILKFICSWKCFQKMPIEDTQSSFWLLSGQKEPQLPKTLFNIK